MPTLKALKNTSLFLGLRGSLGLKRDEQFQVIQIYSMYACLWCVRCRIWILTDQEMQGPQNRATKFTFSNQSASEFDARNDTLQCEMATNYPCSRAAASCYVLIWGDAPSTAFVWPLWDFFSLYSDCCQGRALHYVSPGWVGKEATKNDTLLYRRTYVYESEVTKAR